MAPRIFLLFFSLVSCYTPLSAAQSGCPKPYMRFDECRTSRDCGTFCCARINREPTVGWTGKCCVPRFLAHIVRAKGWCVDKLDVWDRLQHIPSCPFPDDVRSCYPTCKSDSQCQNGEACCTNVCGHLSCVPSSTGNDVRRI